MTISRLEGNTRGDSRLRLLRLLAGRGLAESVEEVLEDHKSASLCKGEGDETGEAYDE